MACCEDKISSEDADYCCHRFVSDQSLFRKYLDSMCFLSILLSLDLYQIMFNF